MLHGVERYIIEGEGMVAGALVPPKPRPGGAASAALVDPFETPEKRLLTPPRRFCRLFPEGAQPDAEALKALGLAMETEDAANTQPDSSIAAGFTYFGQFVDHDINFDRTPLTVGGSADPGATINNRTPALDLDSVYGGGPGVRPDLYEADRATFRVGLCADSADAAGNPITGQFRNDFVRVARKAVIGDPRNDENLALAQLHIAFLKFHNSFIREIKATFPALPAATLFKRAREATIKHYQRMVLRDFLPKIIDPNAIEAVLSGGHRIFKPQDHDHMPIEFSVAAFRLGHSMIRPKYEWNRVFHSKPNALAPATLELLFEFTQFSGSTTPDDSPFFGAETLPSNWIVDWRMMFDVEGKPPPTGFKINRARKLDTHLANALKKLPEFLSMGVADPALVSLASRNLLRGRLVKLPHGLAVADAIIAAGLPHAKLTEAQLRGGPHGAKLEAVGLLKTPPLWYYILREGEMLNGERLGAVGSAIVAETLVAHVRNADVSVLADPSINSITEVPRYSVSEMLKRVNDLNPLG